jgi:hypothetical protein
MFVRIYLHRVMSNRAQRSWNGRLIRSGVKGHKRKCTALSPLSAQSGRVDPRVTAVCLQWGIPQELAELINQFLHEEISAWRTRAHAVFNGFRHPRTFPGYSTTICLRELRPESHVAWSSHARMPQTAYARFGIDRACPCHVCTWLGNNLYGCMK